MKTFYLPSLVIVSMSIGALLLGKCIAANMHFTLSFLYAFAAQTAIFSLGFFLGYKKKLL